MNEYTQYLPASRELIGEPEYVRASNGTLRGRLISTPKHKFSFTLYLDSTEVNAFLAGVPGYLVSPFSFTWQEDSSEYTVLMTKNPVVSQESGFAKITVTVEEV